MSTLSLASARWQFRDATEQTPWRAATVPGCVHTDLRRHRLIPDPFWGTNELELQWIEEHDWEYRTTFRVSAALLAEENLDLVADGLDTVATVRLNGRLVARTENMFLGHRWAVRPLLRPGANELVIRFGSAMKYIRTHRPAHTPREFNDPVGRSQVIRKQPCQFGWDWGPRLVTAGIWRDLRLEAWSGNRLETVRITQKHRKDGSVLLTFEPELARKEAKIDILGTVSLNGKVVSQIANLKSLVVNPALWWPNGHGAQPLYQIELAVTDRHGGLIGRWSKRIGLRTLVLDRHPDAAGETFQFVVNGRAIFAKGANWIPAHSFVAGLTRADYARDLTSAAAAHMNMLRVWGGGIYESTDFYDLCDELGLMIWQDFMFSCSIYPGDAAFRASVRAEAVHQVKRLRHHACLALWCGNNEIAQLNTYGGGINKGDLIDQPKLRRDYEAIFHQLLPAAVAAHDGVTAYWPSSQWRNTFADSVSKTATHPAGEQRGDTHYWDVWHARHPVKDYEKWRFRFCSEFGMQSYCSPATTATFTPPDRRNVFGPLMENHQKNRAGNQIILDYVSRRYRFPKSQEALIYLSQLNQAHCMQVGVEHYRRHMPHCMGALYWQLNDCWPVASWSSLEFTGRWKALHHAARRFFAPALVSAHVPGDEDTIIGNYRTTTVDAVHLHTVYDAPAPARGELRWELFHLDEHIITRGRKKVILRPGESVRQQTLRFGKLMAAHGRDNLHLRIALVIGRRRVSEETVFFAPPRFLNLQRPKTKVAIRAVGPAAFDLTFRTSAFQHRFAFDLPGLAHRSDDNWFELYPDEPKTVRVLCNQPQSLARVRKSLVHQSLVDSY
ncbi:Exo-beta-D-glucosaminidase precursor [Lacunisphaera limnophila]|uniref:Beta-mannosidase B n=1 Tax=Lacunisphaera limnophila TaxID=1838286 RepID=A0A1D8ARQ4_9BACT|nr:glycoside hydrolase family 2 protein [Lacunisphaera limnophila]AOS43556.1 Exo-beta-D-glucosaminidase precursor [Lacunisphaera limnophila]